MARPTVLVIDNYDSFTWNLVHYLQELGVAVRVERNDALGAAEALATDADAILISPGPCTPNEAGVSLDLVAACADAARPLLGVCLGHQAIGQHFGGRVVRGGLMHGKTSPIAHDATGVFAGLPSPFTATRYHSLVVEDVPDTLRVTARAPDGSVMGLAHRALPIHGVQFHPESIATEHGHALLANFLALAGVILPGTGRGAAAKGGGGGDARPYPAPPSVNPASVESPLHQPAAGLLPRPGKDLAA